MHKRGREEGYKDAEASHRAGVDGARLRAVVNLALGRSRSRVQIGEGLEQQRSNACKKEGGRGRVAESPGARHTHSQA